MTDLSIIIVCYRGWARLTKCLESLENFTGSKFKTEVIIVDNNSEDDTLSQIESRFAHFRFIHNNVNGGFGNGCNLGVKNAAGNFLLFLNPDTVASESEIGKLIETAELNPAFSILSCRQVNEKGKDGIVSGEFPHYYNLTGLQRALLKNLSHSHLRKESFTSSDIVFPDWISGSVVLMRREFFLKLKGFDEDFWMYYEDVDLCKRATDAGGKIALCRNITIEHNHGGSSRVNQRTASLTKTEVLISKHVYISKHKKGAGRFLIQLFLVINNIVSGGLMALPGLVLFFVPKVFTRAIIFGRLISYYSGSVLRMSWISPRSVNGS